MGIHLHRFETLADEMAAEYSEPWVSVIRGEGSIKSCVLSNDDEYYPFVFVKKHNPAFIPVRYYGDESGIPNSIDGIYEWNIPLAGDISVYTVQNIEENMEGDIYIYGDTGTFPGPSYNGGNGYIEILYQIENVAVSQIIMNTGDVSFNKKNKNSIEKYITIDISNDWINNTFTIEDTNISEIELEEIIGGSNEIKNIIVNVINGNTTVSLGAINIGYNLYISFYNTDGEYTYFSKIHDYFNYIMFDSYNGSPKLHINMPT